MRLGVIGTSGGVSFSAKGFDRALSEIGHNTGNAMFQYALWDAVKNPKSIIAIGDDPVYVRDNCDALLIPAANQINPAWDLSAWADFIENVNLPCIVIGLGAQSDDDGDYRLNLKPGTLRYIRAISERSLSKLGVRGPFTQKVLQYLGVENVEITGCPTQLINNNLSGKSIADKIHNFDSIENPNIGYTFGTLEEMARRVESRLSNIIKGHRHAIIHQTGKHFLKHILGEPLNSEEKNFFSWAAGVLFDGMSGEEYMDYTKEFGVFYSDARSWIDSMRQFDIVIGMRIHGTIAAIQSGGLGVCVAFDSRTKELAETMGYPYILDSDVMQCDSLADMMQFIVFDSDRFDHLRVVLPGRIKSILSESGCVIDSN